MRKIWQEISCLNGIERDAQSPERRKARKRRTLTGTGQEREAKEASDNSAPKRKGRRS